MPSFPLAYALIPFGLLFLLVGLFFFFNIFHINRYAIRSPGTTLLLVAYVGTFLGLILLTGIFLLSVDWTKTFKPSDLLPSFNSSSRLD